MSDVDFTQVATIGGIAALAAVTGGAGLAALGGVPAAGLGSAVGAGTTATAGAKAGAALGGAVAKTAGAIASNPIQAGLTAATVGSGAASVIQQREVAEQGRRANAARERIAEIRNRRARLQTIEQSRVAQAQVQQAGANVGAGPGSTSVRGQVSALRSQTASNIGLQQTTRAAERSIFDAEASAARASARADLFGQASRLGAELGGTAPVRTLFD